MAASFEAYIDESGCDGFAFERGSSEWLTLAAVVVRTQNSGRLVTLLDEVRDVAGLTRRKPIHFKKLHPQHKRAYLERIAGAPIRVAAVLVHKPRLERATFAGGSRLYFYAAKMLLERISWIARDFGPGSFGDGTVDLTFSKRKSMPYRELEAYLEKLFEERCHNTSIDWSVLQPKRFAVMKHSKRAGLQVADACAHAVWRRLEAPRAVEHARLLKPVLYRRRKKLLGYGVKVWPASAEELLVNIA